MRQVSSSQRALENTVNNLGLRATADRRKYMGDPGEDWAARARRGDEAMP